ncbi:penicillin acylase family protein [Pseudomonas kuykendallii]|uniref:Penicillin acylase family protein n=1 Tax=Pseudomonas kuykendallii TaxID=1007099 RepID=A0A2W5CUS8_9PSED|nr:penicillin acylase family protein [Pseudomonas kuykendallii]PZP21748.1 MAG: penicillin acylase family protein [Pseudomonas kuykendallii]
MKRVLTLLVLLLAVVAGGGAWYFHGKQPMRSGERHLAGLEKPVEIRYDDRGVPHIRAQTEADLYRTLGYAHAQDRLFQMELMRRLARGELAEIFGAKLVDTDRLFRTLRLGEHAEAYAARVDRNGKPWKALEAYLAGVNQFQDSHPAPLEFDLLGIRKRPFTAADTFAINGYTAYSFAVSLRTNPLLTFIRDRLGADYLRAFDIDWQPQGALAGPALAAGDWKDLGRIAQLSADGLEDAGLPQFEGSNAWVVSGARTASGKALLAGDPHIRFSNPAVWYEAHTQMPGSELYGHYQALTPFAMLGHNAGHAWSLTMFQNADLDLIAEEVNPDDPEQVRYQGRWVTMEKTEQSIRVKDAEPVTLTLRRSPHGPIITDALGKAAGKTPIAMWWAFLETENPLIDAFYGLRDADSLEQARAAAEKIHAPGLNLVYANAHGDIAWWAAAKLVRRPEGVNPLFILDARRGEAEKPGFYPFSANPQEENPARGYIVSANFQPVSPTGIEIPGHYNLPDRGRELDRQLADATVKWDRDNSQALQLEAKTDYYERILLPILADLRSQVGDGEDRALLERLAAWDGVHDLDSVEASLFNQLLYEIARAAMADELGADYFDTLLNTRVLDHALPRLVADARSPWWDERTTGETESRAVILGKAWQATLAHLREHFGKDPQGWAWGTLHQVTHAHALGQQKPLDRLFNVGPFAAPGGHELPNNLSQRIGPAPWPVTYGPSTRRLVDFDDPLHSLGINPVGQSGVLFDRHNADQARDYIAGRYQPMRMSDDDVAAHAEGTLHLLPAD